MLRKMRFVYIFSRRSPGRDEHRNVRYVEANSRLFQGIPQFPVPTSLTYDTCNTGWYFIVAIYKTTVPLPGARLELEIVSPAHTYIYSLRRFRATRLSVENGVIYFEKRSDGSLESRERKEFRFLPEMRLTSFPRTALTYSYIYYNFHMSR